MATTNFLPKVTKIESSWLNDVDALVYDVFTGVTTLEEARTALDVYATAAVDALIDDLSGVSDAPTARTNLDVYATAEVNALIDDLSGVSDTPTARVNLGLELGVAVQAFDADTLKADVPDVLTAGFATTAVALAGASVTPGLTLANVFTWPVTANATLNNPVVVGAGVWYIYATVDATGGYTLSLGANINTVSGTFDGAANVVNILQLVSDGTEFDLTIVQRP